MKKTRVSTASELSTDAVYYLFVEWLRRQGVFTAFRSNCGFDEKHNNLFRSVLRNRIQGALRSSYLGVGALISASFIFAHTPEGLAFWSDLSSAWRHFCIDFRNNLK